MPYGPSTDDLTKVSTGTLELLGQKAIVTRDNELNLGDDKIGSQIVWNQPDDAELEDAVEAVKDAGIVIMNPAVSPTGPRWARSSPRRRNNPFGSE